MDEYAFGEWAARKGIGRLRRHLAKSSGRRALLSVQFSPSLGLQRSACGARSSFGPSAAPSNSLFSMSRIEEVLDEEDSENGDDAAWL